MWRQTTAFGCLILKPCMMSMLAALGGFWKQPVRLE